MRSLAATITALSRFALGITGTGAAPEAPTPEDIRAVAPALDAHTRSTLIAFGQSAQIGYHLGRAMDNGLTREQASEVLTQTVF